MYVLFPSPFSHLIQQKKNITSIQHPHPFSSSLPRRKEN